MKRMLGVGLVLLLVCNFGYSQISKVELSFKQEMVYVLLDDKLVGMDPELIKINFDLNKDLYFYKKGFFSQRVEIDPEIPFSRLTIDLIPKVRAEKDDQKKILDLDTLLVSRIVTNFTRNDLNEIIENNFIENNFFIGKNASLFAGADSEIKNTKYKIGIEIVDSRQIRSVYKAPRFMMAQINIRWSLYEIESNKVVYFNATEGSYFVKIQKPKGLVVSELMERVMEGAINEAQTKLFVDEKFMNLMLDK